MATTDDSNLCSTCNKPAARRFCVGCKNYFCSKDFKEHEQDLSTKFDNEIVQSHDELFDQIQKLDQPNYLSFNLFDQIEEWKKTTIRKVEKAAENAHHELTELINKQRTVLIQELEPITKEIRSHRQEENFAENDIERLKQKLNETQRKIQQFIQECENKTIIIDNDQINWSQLIYICKPQNLIPRIPVNAQWSPHGKTVAGNNGVGNIVNELCRPYSLSVADDDQTIIIADSWNNRIVQWKIGDTNGQVVAGGKGQGNGLNQLCCPTDVLIDKETDSLIISDWQNRRVVRWSRRNETIQGEILINNVCCRGLFMDNQRCLYVSDNEKQEVRRYRMEGDMRNGDLVAGGHGKGSGLSQLNAPLFIFVDQQHAVYVSDHLNHRVMKWNKNATAGIVAAGGQGKGVALTQLSHPEGLFVDEFSTLYVAESRNHRVTRWPQGAIQGTAIIGVDTPINWPVGLSFDRQGNIYVSDSGQNGPHRIQRFSIQ
ncbi:unnamed protein product [Rotaria socialis]|uniref:Uncharacterized protein n=1 Tax=Rotaria socialis TaxID=392032 RepID=A0A818AGA9_9BILA|nr:unnamed protein product [Rotaria socialis]CAF4684417.1 unnamed protein product [Rotaria socialis]